MKSTIASLQTITLPFGAGSGQRIVLDGVTGEIRIYDSNDNLLVLISPAGIVIYDASGDVRMRFASPGATDPYSLLELFTARVDESRGGFVSLADDTHRNRMVLTPGENNDHGSLELALYPEADDGIRQSLFQVIAPSVEAGSLRPLIDLTGASSPSGKEPRTIVHDLWFGTPNVYGNAPDQVVNAGRGIIAYGQNVSNSLISTTNGTYASIVESSDANVTAGRRYRVTMTSAFDILTGGSGWGPTDYWTGKFQRSLDAGANWADIYGPSVVARHATNVAVRMPLPLQYCYYDPIGSATVRWRFVLAKGSGAATVTSTVEANALAPTQIAIEDVGLAI